MEIRQLFNIIKRWIWLMILGLVFGAVFGYYFSSRETPKFQASTRFGVLDSYYDLGTYQYYRNDSLLEILIELLASDSFLEQVETELGFQVSKGQARLDLNEDTIFIDLTVLDQDPEKAAAIANGLVPIIIDEIKNLGSEQYILAEEILSDQIEQVETQMETVQAQINDISEANIEENLSDVQAQIIDLQGQINELEFKISEIDPTFATDEQLFELAQYQDGIEQLQPILELYQQIYTNLIVLGQPVEEERTGFSKLDQLQTSFDIYREIYINSVANLEQIRIEKVRNTFTVIDPQKAKVPQTPISPKPLQTALLSAAVGLIGTCGIAFLVEYLDDTIKTPDEIKHLTGLPVLGYISHLPSKGISKGSNNGIHHLFFSTQPRSAVSEALRSVRTNLEFSAVDNPLKSILITSANPAEGKSTIAANLALAVAQSGKKTLLLDADIRRPSIHKFFKLSNRTGLSDLLIGKLDIDQVIASIDSEPNINIISSGSLPHNPSELLSSNKMGQILANLETHFEVIIIDSSPLVVTDPQILASRVDGVLCVILPGKTRVQHITKLMQQLNTINARILGVILNRIPIKRNSYYYGYYQHQNRNTNYFDDEADGK